MLSFLPDFGSGAAFQSVAGRLTSGPVSLTFSSPEALILSTEYQFSSAYDAVSEGLEVFGQKNRCKHLLSVDIQ